MLVYTFRTYPYIDELKGIFPDLFIFGSLKEDMKTFEQLLKYTQRGVLGVADTKRHSRIETIAINKFNNGKLEKSGPNELRLYADPRLGGITLAQKPTSTFCNWTMYKIQAFIDSQNIDSKFTFIHINVKDLDRLNALNSCQSSANMHTNNNPLIGIPL